MEEMRTLIVALMMGVILALALAYVAPAAAPKVVVQADGVTEMTWDWTKKDSSVRVTATSAKLITNDGVAVVSGATATTQEPTKATTTEWEEFGIRMLIFAALGIGVALLVGFIKKKIELGGLKTVAVLVVLCMGGGSGVTALLKDGGVSSIVSNPPLLITGILMTFFSAYLVNQVFLKRRA